MTTAAASLAVRLFVGLATAGVAAHPGPPGRSQAVVAEGRLTRISGDVAGAPAGLWLAEDLMGGGVIDRLRTVLELDAGGRVSGSGGCNAVGGTASIEGDTIRFADLVSTQKMCVPAAMDQERKFFDVLEAARGWRVDAERGKLMLLDGAGAQIAIFARE